MGGTVMNNDLSENFLRKADELFREGECRREIMGLDLALNICWRAIWGSEANKKKGKVYCHNIEFYYCHNDYSVNYKPAMVIIG